MDSGAVPDPVPPPTLELLADLQAGVLDDATAARVRRMIRADPHAARTLAALDETRRALADLATDDAPEVPADVVARITGALRRAADERDR